MLSLEIVSAVESCGKLQSRIIFRGVLGWGGFEGFWAVQLLSQFAQLCSLAGVGTEC